MAHRRITRGTIRSTYEKISKSRSLNDLSELFLEKAKPREGGAGEPRPQKGELASPATWPEQAKEGQEQRPHRERKESKRKKKERRESVDESRAMLEQESGREAKGTSKRLDATDGAARSEDLGSPTQDE